MKQPKKLTREQKECLSAHYLNCKDWMLVEETEFYYRIINKNTGMITPSLSSILTGRLPGNTYLIREEIIENHLYKA